MVDVLRDAGTDVRGDDDPAATETAPASTRRRVGLVRRTFMRPRRLLVKVHRWLSIALLAWLVVLSLTGAWLVVNKSTGSWIDRDLYRTTRGDVGPEAVAAAVTKRLPEGSSLYGVTMPANGRGVYQVSVGVPEPGAAEDAEPTYELFYVDPGTGKVSGVRNDEEGLTHWLYRGHMYLWQDQGIAAAFNADHGWCRAVKGVEPGGVKGAVCDVVPDGEDMVAWLGLAWIVVLFTGFYLWYWPGVRRWATAFVVRRGRGRFTFHLSVHKVIGLVVFVPLTVVAVTGVAFAFPNMKGWFENVTPAQRGAEMWEPPEALLTSTKAAGRAPIGLDRFLAELHRTFPKRTVQIVAPPSDETGTYTAWMTSGFDPWTREGGAGNVWVVADQYSGKIVYDGTPEDVNAFDQAWSNWSFPMHAGDFGGTTTRIVWVGLGLSPIVLGATGVVMNLVRRRKRANRAARADAPVAVG